MAKILIALGIVIIGIMAGWYVMAQRGTLSTLSGTARPGVTPTATGNPTPTLLQSGLFEYRDGTVAGRLPTGTVRPSATPTRSIFGSATKGGTLQPTATVRVTPTTKPNTAKAAVTFGGTGFSPAVLTVRKNTTVVFTNNSDTGMRVTSPTLSGLNQGTTAGRGGTYEYTYTAVGTWKYYNVSSAGPSGMVIVTQ